MAELNLVTLDQEKITRTLMAVGVDHRMIDIVLQLHDTTRVTEKMLGELLDEQKKIVDALKLLTRANAISTDRLQKIEKKYGGNDNVNDIVSSEKFDG